MFGVSGVDLVVSACRAGVVGAFPTANAGAPDTLQAWLRTMAGAVDRARDAPFCPNLIMRDPRTAEHLEILRDFAPEVVITSVGSPARAVEQLRPLGTMVLADVASLHHARRAVAEGAHGLVLLSAGAGGNSGWLNPFAFVRAVRQFFDGPLVLAGGMSDGVALRAAISLGCDLAYVGTRLIAATESLASSGYRQMLVETSMDDVMTTRAFSGLDANMLRPSILRAGLDPEHLPEFDPAAAKQAYGAGQGPQRWRDIWSAGHSVSGVGRVSTVAEVVEDFAADFNRPAGAT
jgi:nitronate monooxygenase